MAVQLEEVVKLGETRLIISSIVLAEMYYANAKNKGFPDYVTVYTDLIGRRFFKFLPFDYRHVLDFDHDQRVTEMHDRIMAGLARRLGAPLLTCDPLITAAAIVTTVW